MAKWNPGHRITINSVAFCPTSRATVGKRPKNSKDVSVGTPICWNTRRAHQTIQFSNVRTCCRRLRLRQMHLALSNECMGLRYALLQFISSPPCFGNDYLGFVC